MPTTRHDRRRSKLTRGGRPAGADGSAAASTPVAPAAAASAVVGRRRCGRRPRACGALAERQRDRDHAEQDHGARPREDRSGRRDRDREARGQRAERDAGQLGRAEAPERFAGSGRVGAHEQGARGGHEHAEPESAERATGDEVPGLGGERRPPSAATMSSTPMTPMVRARPRSAKGATMSSAASDAANPAAATNPMSAVEMPSCDWSVGSSGKMTMAPEDMSTVAVTTPAVSRRRCWSTAVRCMSLLVHMDSTVPSVVRMDKSATMEAW